MRSEYDVQACLEDDCIIDKLQMSAQLMQFLERKFIPFELISFGNNGMYDYIQVWRVECVNCAEVVGQLLFQFPVVMMRLI
jgi:hypothetical protein